jgi:hypothetical protein
MLKDLKKTIWNGKKGDPLELILKLESVFNGKFASRDPINSKIP